MPAPSIGLDFFFKCFLDSPNVWTLRSPCSRIEKGSGVHGVEHALLGDEAFPLKQSQAGPDKAQMEVGPFPYVYQPGCFASVLGGSFAS